MSQTIASQHGFKKSSAEEGRTSPKSLIWQRVCDGGIICQPRVVKYSTPCRSRRRSTPGSHSCRNTSGLMRSDTVVAEDVFVAGPYLHPFKRRSPTDA